MNFDNGISAEAGLPLIGWKPKNLNQAWLVNFRMIMRNILYGYDRHGNKGMTR